MPVTPFEFLSFCTHICTFLWPAILESCRLDCVNKENSANLLFCVCLCQLIPIRCAMDCDFSCSCSCSSLHHPLSCHSITCPFCVLRRGIAVDETYGYVIVGDSGNNRKHFCNFQFVTLKISTATPTRNIFELARHASCPFFFAVLWCCRNSNLYAWLQIPPFDWHLGLWRRRVQGDGGTRCHREWQDSRRRPRAALRQVFLGSPGVFGVWEPGAESFIFFLTTYLLATYNLLFAICQFACVWK